MPGKCEPHVGSQPGRGLNDGHSLFYNKAADEQHFALAVIAWPAVWMECLRVDTVEQQLRRPSELDAGERHRSRARAERTYGCEARRAHDEVRI